MVALSLVLGGTAFAAVTAGHQDARADRRLVKKLAPSLSVRHATTADSAAAAASATHAAHSDKIRGPLPSYYLPPAVARPFGPTTVHPTTGGLTNTTLVTLGQLTFAGYCVDNGTDEDVSLVISTSADHAAYAAMSGNIGAVSARNNPDELSNGFYVLGEVFQ